MTSTHLRIPEKTLKKIKHRAIDENKTQSQWICEAIDEKLEEKEE